jgi:hypothetical protein
VRKIINSTYITLDGVVGGPHLWPSLISDHINAMPKYVVWTTLKDPDRQDALADGLGERFAQ